MQIIPGTPSLFVLCNTNKPLAVSTDEHLNCQLVVPTRCSPRLLPRTRNINLQHVRAVCAPLYAMKRDRLPEEDREEVLFDISIGEI
jgi:hypothetical protein